MTRPLAMALVQAPPVGVRRALSEFAEEVRGVAEGFPRTQIIVYPEYHVCGLEGDAPALEQYRQMAEPLSGPRMRRLADIARISGRWLIPGTVIELGQGGELLNCCPVFNPRGEVVATYRKMFPWRPFEPWKPGTEFSLFEIPGIGRLGLSICYDTWFPEVFRQLAWMGAEVIINVSYTVTSDRAQETVLARAHAIVNQVFFVTVNAATPGAGKSMVVDPEGHVRSESFSEAPTVLTDCIDLDAVSLARRQGTAALDRPWSQFADGDVPLELPVYQGRIDPAAWDPAAKAHVTSTEQ